MTQRALLVGINKYRVQGADLNGCVNDVDDMRALLVECGVDSNNIEIITDYDATTANMKTAIQKLVDETEEDDAILFHYSGHGSQKVDLNQDEIDGLDEILCPTNVDWVDNNIVDDWLGDQFKKIQDKAFALVTLDSCHSGTGLRAFGMRKNAQRFIPPPIDFQSALSEKLGMEFNPLHFAAELTDKFYPYNRDAIQKGFMLGVLSFFRWLFGFGSQNSPVVPTDDLSDVPVGQRGVVLMSGCRADQTSADAYIQGRWNGAFTRYLVDSVRYCREHGAYWAPLDDIVIRTHTSLKSNGYDQVPQLEEDFKDKKWLF